MPLRHNQIANKEPHIPGEPGVWVFIFGDMIVFGLFFVTFIFYRSGNIELFRDSQMTLNQPLGLVNTILLLISSWFVAVGIRYARHGDFDKGIWFFRKAIACGAAFGGIKFIEYSEKIRVDIILTTNDFYMFYFMYTGVHMLHVIIGIAVLVYLCALMKRSEFCPADMRTLEGGACFWHLVDILWIIIFALFYLIK